MFALTASASLLVRREGVGEADIGLALGDAAAEVAAGVFAAAEPDEDDHVQRSVGCAVAGEVDPVAFGAPTGCGNRSGRAQVGERRLRAEPVDVLADGDEQGRGVVGAASQTRRGRGRCGCVEFVSEFGGFGAEAGDAMAQVAQCWVGGLGGTGEPVLVGPQPGGRRSLSLEGPAAVELGAHLDLFTGDMGTDVARLVALGASVLVPAAEETAGHLGFRATIMADPEGSEFCVVSR